MLGRRKISQYFPAVHYLLGKRDKSMKRSRNILIVISSVLVWLTGCGALNVQQAKEGAKEVKVITLKVNYREAFNLATLSEYASSIQSKSALNENSGTAHIWYGGENNVYAVIEFVKLGDEATKVAFYNYGGYWDDRLDGIRRILLRYE